MNEPTTPADNQNAPMAVASGAVLGCDHEPNTVCQHCGLPVDAYGNTEDELINCCFPDCGCDGARLCMAKNGASRNAEKCNVEGMYERTDLKARRAKIGLIGLCIDRDAKRPNAKASNGDRFFTAVPSETEQHRNERLLREKEEAQRAEVERIEGEIKTLQDKLTTILGASTSNVSS